MHAILTAHLFSSIILTAIGYGAVKTGTPQEIRWQTLHNLSVGNIILSVAGLIPGYWVSFLFIDSVSSRSQGASPVCQCR